ncbi:gamma-glutamyl-gamma-aminobutyrate hydrolase family protein [Streptococcus oralis]|uniref:gamma-glutamyl-gamma-aminobutyrate hydrolase family protein n=1 Tax=Streptococcus oralis TaxID=1303 RepID=UPI000A10C877|nr:gamma-glutamyl-gamma-aminobutyrate hydrolase family protein [Streptococcus oralis]ORO84905.1 gamma-glutamyl hydrolase [Streptococcus oralis subsp. dentisani]
MARTVVGVAANLCPVDAEGKNIHSSVSCKFAESIRQVGGLPLVIPVGDESIVRDYVEMIDKLILTGGQNVHPQFYGEKKTIESDDYNLVRDEFELALLREALHQNKPILAICRGVQLVNVAFGGTLHQEIEGHWQGLPFGTSHSIETVEESVVAKLFGKESQVNSVHRQSIKDLAPNFRVTAVDPRDQTVEAIESIDEHRIIGLQWHPEFLVNEEDGNLELFEYLLNEL